MREKVDFKDYDINYSFDPKTKRGQVEVFQKLQNEGNEKKLIGMFYRLNDKIWKVYGGEANEEYYQALHAIEAVIHLHIKIKKEMLELRKQMGQSI